MVLQLPRFVIAKPLAIGRDGFLLHDPDVLP